MRTTTSPRLAGRTGRCALATLAALMLPTDVEALAGTVSRVTDGDTVWVQPEDPDSRPVKVRLEGIDAPERCQLDGPQASEALRRRVLGRAVVVTDDGRDAWGRTLGPLRLDGEDIGAWMVAQGWAWSYRYRDRPGRYDALEQSARERQRGLFARPDPMRPDLFRRIHGPCRTHEAP